MEENKNAVNEQNQTITVAYSKLTQKLIARDMKRAAKAAAKNAANPAGNQTDEKKPKWRKIVGWVAGGAAAVGAATYAVVKVIGNHQSDEELTEEDLATLDDQQTDAPMDDPVE